MRISIEIDGNEGTSLSANASGREAAFSDGMGVDSGPGPSDGGVDNAGVDAGGVSDAGPPPDWLLESVGTAEKGEHSPPPTDGSGAGGDLGDAGPGPAD